MPCLLYTSPKSVQAIIPIKTIWEDGIFLVGNNKYAKTFKLEDINYSVASREDKEAMFWEYSELLNSLDSGATTKITVNNLRNRQIQEERPTEPVDELIDKVANAPTRKVKVVPVSYTHLATLSHISKTFTNTLCHRIARLFLNGRNRARITTVKK